MPRLAHISDIHFGPTFDFEIWNRVRAQIEEFAPEIVVVSGDLVDHPLPFDLLAVKCELESLSKDRALFVVPGNHDVRMWGNVVYPWRSGWFERIMFNDTTQAKQAIEKSLGITLGLNRESRALRNTLKRLNPFNAIRWNVPKNKCDGRHQSCDFRRCGRWPIASAHSQVAIACFDSNPARLGTWALASGEVAQAQLTRLGGQGAQQVTCNSADCPHRSAPAVKQAEDASLLRVAVVHHHPLPIALAREARSAQEVGATLEPFVVLRNSGDFLHRLQEQKFDLILHGHQHRSQFARIELQANDLDAYTLIVLAAGCTAKSDEAHNTLRLIETEGNGRLNVRSILQGAEQEPYREPIPHLKQRAFNRALERTKRATRELLVETIIDGVGHVWNRHRFTDLHALSGGEVIKDLPFRVAMPPHGVRFEDRIQPDDDSHDRIKVRWVDGAGITRDPRDIPAEDREGGYCLIELTEPLKPGSPQDRATFGIKNAAANSIAMTSWELAERSRSKSVVYPDRESIWRYVNHPIGKLVLRLTMPEELDGVTPELRCLRHKAYPQFPLTFRRDISIQGGLDEFHVDEELQEEEVRKLRYDASKRTWCLDVERPMPGYSYELRWRVPHVAADHVVAGATRDYQSMLLALGERLSNGDATSLDQRCSQLFSDGAGELMKLYSSRNPREQQAAFLMVYQPKDLHLYPVLTGSSRAGVESAFHVPMGAGVAGASFVHRRILAWGLNPDSVSLIKPIPVPGMDAHHILALPIYHQQHEGPRVGQLDVEPGAVIGVMTLASDAEGSKIAQFQRGSEQAKPAQAVAQAMTFQILDMLSAAPRTT